MERQARGTKVGGRTTLVLRRAAMRDACAAAECGYCRRRPCLIMALEWDHVNVVVESAQPSSVCMFICSNR